LGSLGIPTSPTYAVAVPGIADAMSYIPNNVDNEISAKDLRDIILFLYENSGGGPFLYSGLAGSSPQNPAPSTNEVGNWKVNTIFDKVTLQTLFDGIFYKDSGPSVTLTPDVVIDYRGPVAPLPSLPYSWSVTKRTYSLNTAAPVTENGVKFLDQTIPTTGGSGTFNRIPLRNIDTTYTITVYDTGVPVRQDSDSASVVYQNRFYFGKVTSRAMLNTAQIKALVATKGGQAESGRLSANFFRSFVGVSGLGGGGTYIAFAFPSIWTTQYGILVNGVKNPPFKLTDNKIWTGPAKVGSLQFTNDYDYVTEYDVWITQSSYNSEFNDFKIAA